MYFSKEKKLCLYEPPKTGTRTAQAFLRSVGWHFLAPDHGFPEDYLKAHPNLYNYKAFAFFRNPLDRFISLILFVKQHYSSNIKTKDKNIKDYSYEEFVNSFDVIKSHIPILSAAQSCWMTHPNTEVLNFDNYEAEIRRISGDYTNPVIIKNKSTDFGRSVVTQKVIDFVRQEYAADYALAKDRLGKEY